MSKLIIKLIFIIYLASALSCSYKPIFSEKNYNFGIEEISFADEGSKDINRIIKNRFDLIQEVNNRKQKKYSLAVKTSKIRNIISKDSKGDPVKFELFIIADYEIIENQKIIFSKIIEKKEIYDNNSDKFKLGQEEKIILDNLSRRISDEILTSIVNLNDN